LCNKDEYCTYLEHYNRTNIVVHVRNKITNILTNCVYNIIKFMDRYCEKGEGCTHNLNNTK
jgi:hypothetical protein